MTQLQISIRIVFVFWILIEIFSGLKFEFFYEIEKGD
jgi:hypothetical protein